MNKIYTSYYSNLLLKDNNNANIIEISISRGTPKYNTAYKISDQIMPLAPTWDMIKMVDKDLYKQKYFKILDLLGIDKIKSLLEPYREKSDIVLLCFEDIKKPGQWCHRTMFAEWWESKTGEKIIEFEKIEDKTKEFKQMSLF